MTITDAGAPTRPQALGAMANALRHITWRGHLRSCNYACDYCPFAKKAPSADEHGQDAAALLRFCRFLEETPFEHPISVLLAPYGEALMHKRYPEALARLSRNPAVRQASCQTNMSLAPEVFLQQLRAEGADLSRLALWATFHPAFATPEEFAEKTRMLAQHLRMAVGAVGDPAALPALHRLKALLPAGASFWINAMDGLNRAYTAGEKDALTALDARFPLELRPHAPDLLNCSAGRSSLFVLADGSAYPCNRSKLKLGNIYAACAQPEAHACAKKSAGDQQLDATAIATPHSAAPSAKSGAVFSPPAQDAGTNRPMPKANRCKIAQNTADYTPAAGAAIGGPVPAPNICGAAQDAAACEQEADAPAFEPAPDAGPCQGRCDCFMAYAARKDLPALLGLAPAPQLRLAAQRVKALFLDLDGTLTGPDGNIRPSVAALLPAVAGRFGLYTATALPLPYARRKFGPAWQYLAGGVFAYGADARDFTLGRNTLRPLPEPQPDSRFSYTHDGRIYKQVLRQRPSPTPPNCRIIEENGVISLCAETADKLDGVLQICKWHGWRPEEVIVMGDALPDLPMLEYFPLSVAPRSAAFAALRGARFHMEAEELFEVILQDPAGEY